VVVNLQGDEPFVDPRDAEAMLAPLHEGRADIVTLRTPIESLTELLDPNAVKVVTRDDGLALYFSRAPIPFERAQSGSFAGAFRHIGVYGYRHEALVRMVSAPVHALEAREALEQLRALGLGMRLLVLDAKTQSRGIDTAADLEAAEALVRSRGDTAFPG